MHCPDCLATHKKPVQKHEFITFINATLNVIGHHIFGKSGTEFHHPALLPYFD